MKRPFILAAWILSAGWLAMPADAQTSVPATSAAKPASSPAKAPKKKLVIPPTVELIADVEYSRPDGSPLLLDLYLPKAPAAKPRPLVVWIHGGGWWTGNKSSAAGTPALRLVERGFAFASIDYRLTNVAIFPAQIEDCKTAIRFLRANASRYNIDPDHIGVWGGSAGGHLAALLGVTNDIKELDGSRYGYSQVSSAVQAVVTLYGLHDLPALSNPGPRVAKILRDFLGGSVVARHDLAVTASPITYVKKGVVPFLIYHGEKDPAVPVDQSRRFYDRLRQAGVEATYHEIHGGGHDMKSYPADRYAQEITAFFEKHLGKPPAAASKAP